jgi:hypothetical protein
MLFREPHRARLAIRLLSLLGAYYERYKSVRETFDDWVFLYDVFLQLEKDRGDHARSRKILALLADLCLAAFRREVFQRLATVRGLSGPHVADALEGRRPLTIQTFRDVLPGGQLERCIYPLGAKGTRIRYIDVMFAVL